MLLMLLSLSLLMTGTVIGADVTNMVKNPNVVKNQNIVKPSVEGKVLNLAKVPNVVGMTEPQAGPDDDCNKNKGLVTRQDPAAGSMVAPHSKVKLVWCN